MSRNENVVAMILGNPVMIDAYQAGIPGKGKPVPEGITTLLPIASNPAPRPARRRRATTPSAGARAT
jgi:hypothetical protein